MQWCSCTNITKNNLPGMFNEMFIQNENHFTWQQNQLHVHKSSNAAVGKTIQYKGSYFETFCHLS